MNIFSHLLVIPDPRKDVNIKHNLFDVLFLVLPAVAMLKNKKSEKAANAMKKGGFKFEVQR